MMSCAIYGCTNNTATTVDPAIQYYYFPKHPIMAQQWLSACWRADPIDLNTAQICSIHFGNDSYTSEYKILDYLGNYARMLKYDAVPTLYLPIPHHTPVIMKADIEQPIPINSDGIEAEIKEIIVYEVHGLENQAPTFNPTSVKNYMAIVPEQPLVDSGLKEPSTAQEKPNEPVKGNDPIDKNEDIEKYKHIETKKQLEELKVSNTNLRRQIMQLEDNIKHIQSQVSEKNQLLKTEDEELRKLVHKYDRLRRTSMSVMDQKSILSKVFSESQIKILSGKKKIYWSNDDMAMGYTIRHLSNKRCYMYLSKNLNIPLPALSSIKRWTTLKKHEYTAKEEQKETSSRFEDEDSE